MTSPIAVGSIVAETYRIASQLGTGGMGSVWAAEHLRLPGKRVAVKVLHTTLTSNEVLLRFRREAEIASRIGHPNIVEVLDFNTLPGGEPFLVMELLAGESLAARLRRGRLSEKATLDIARQIGSALDAAHRMDVVHRDLKPDNIFLCPRDVDGELRDHVKVLDFGISKIRNSQTVLTQDAAVMGTPFYMSPEQASGKNQEIDGRTDVFALGAIVFEMLTGTMAFPGESLPSVIFQVVFQPHPSLLGLAPSTHPRIVAAVDRALAKKADERFQDMGTFIEALTGRPLMITTGPAGQAAAAASAGGALAATLAAPGATASAIALAPTAAPPTAQKPGALAVSAAAVTVPPAPAPATVTAATKRKQGPWLLVGGAVVLGGIAATVAFGLRPPVETPKVAASKPQLPRAVPKPEPPSLRAVDAGQVATADAAAKEPGDANFAAPTLVDKPGGKGARGKTGGREESLPATVAAELDVAEKALAAKDAGEAIRRARHSLYEKKTTRAAAILTRAFCIQGDLGAAKAELSHVAASDRSRVLRACRAAGMDL